MQETQYSENPTADIWKRLLKYSFKSNITKLTAIEDEALLNSISGSIIQSNEYFTMASTATLHTSPLLLYYGCVNLLNASALLITKKEVNIKNHGATFVDAEGSNPIGNSSIRISNSTDGAFYVFNNIFSANNDSPRIWTLKEIFGYIPDIKQEFEDCYPDSYSSCIPIEVVKRKTDKLDRIRLNDLKRTFNKDLIVNFDQSYLQAQETEDFIILRDQLGSKEIGVYSISGQKNLIFYTELDNKNFYLDQIMAFFLGLYCLSVLSRYHSGKWLPFVQRDDSGEIGLIEDFLLVASRKLPNLLLNLIIGKDIHFINDIVGQLDMSKDYDPTEIKDLIRESLQNGRLK